MTPSLIADPIITLGANASDDNKDRGIEFRYHTGSAAKVGFFGYDDSAGVFTFIPDASNSSEVFSGTAGNVAFGNIAGTLTTAAQTNITSVGALDGGSISSGFGAIDTGSSNITTTGLISGGSLDIDNVLINGTTIGHTDDTDLMTLSNGGLVVAGTLEATGNITGTLATAAQTNITSTGALDGGSITSGFGAIDNGTSGIRTNTFTAETSIVPDASGGADIGSTSLEWGDLYIADDKKIYLGSDQDVSIEYDEDGNDTTAIVAAGGVSLAPHGTSTGNGTELRFQELAANGANYVGFKAPDSISSNEVWVLPNADGSADQVLKTDGSNNLSWGTAGGGESFTAKGAIANKRLVGIASDGSGKVEEIFNSRSVGKTSSDSNYFVQRTSDAPKFGTNYYVSGRAIVFDPDTNRHVVVYIDEGDSSDLKANLGTATTSGITFHYGSSDFGVDVDTGTHTSYSVVYDTTNNKVVVFYRDSGSSNSLSARVGTVTGGTTNTISFGTEVNIGDSNAVEYVSAAFDASEGKCIIFYRGESNYLRGVTFTVSGTGGSFGTVTDHSGNAVSMVDVAYNPTTQSSVVIYKNSSNYGCAKDVTLNGTTTVTGSRHLWTTTNYDNYFIEANPDTTSDSTNASFTYDEFLITYEGNNEYLTGIILTHKKVDGSDNECESSNNTTITSRETRGGRISYNSEAGVFVVIYHDKQDNTKAEIRFVKVTSSSLSVLSDQGDPDSTMAPAYYFDVAYDSNIERTIVLISHSTQVSSNKHGWGWVLTPPKSDNHDAYIGVAANAASDGDTVLVKTLGMVAETEKTDMTFSVSTSTTANGGGHMYLTRSSTSTTQSSAIGTSSGTGNTLIGRAITSSKMIVAYNFGGAGHDENYQVDD